MATHALFETASGYAIFKVNFKEDIGSGSKAVQDSVDDLAKFGKMVSLVSFSPFKSAAHALENANDVSEGQSLLFQCPFESYPTLGLRVYKFSGHRVLRRDTRSRVSQCTLLTYPRF
jgi:hypothetical protein